MSPTLRPSMLIITIITLLYINTYGQYTPEKLLPTVIMYDEDRSKNRSRFLLE